MKYNLAIVATALLVGCASIDPSPIRQVTLQLVQTDAEMIRACGHAVFLTAPLGCAKLHASACTIVAYAPRTFDDRRRLETLGHELWHCYKGPNHD